MGIVRAVRKAARERGYKPGLGTFRFDCKYLYNFTLTNLAKISPYGVTNVMHKLRGVKIGKDVFIDRTTYIDEVYPHMVQIDDMAGVAPRAIILAHSKPGEYLESYLGKVKVEKVHIKKGAFVGVGAIVLPGVTLGEGAVVSAGSVVTRSVPDHALVVGNPAKIITQLKKRG